MNALMHKEFKLILNPLFYLIRAAFNADPDPPVGVLRSAVVFLLYGRAQPLYPVQDLQGCVLLRLAACAPP